MPPLVYPLLMIAALVLLAWSKQAYPTARLVWLALVPAAGSLLVLLSPDALIAVLVLDGVLLAMAVADLASLPARSAFAAERQAGRIASLAQPHRVTLTVLNLANRDREVWLRDGLPADLEPEPEEFHVRLPGRSRSVVHYELRARRRGAFRLEEIYLRVPSRLGLWQRHLTYPALTVLHVYPDMKQISEYALLARTNRLSLLGVRRTRKVGQDNEFERLRDYTRDDNFKHIDWRSTARRHKLTVKDFQANQSQRLIFLIDCGRMMTNEAAGLTLLDHSLNAMLMLSYVALRQGDSVGLVCFSDQIHAYVPPRGGMNQMNRLLHASFDRFPRLVESRYEEAFLYTSSRCRKRSLVILVTNIIDEVNAVQVQRYLGALSGRHLPLGVLLRDRQLFDAVEVEDPEGPALFRAAAAADILTWRHQVLSDLSRRGVLTIDVTPESLTAPLVNSYLDIKARHLL
jgi:uncharacterized protein (DUF58 family)